MTINERFELIIKVLFGGNKRAFAVHVGVNPTVVENVVGKRKGKPSFDFLEKVCANANISAEWLLLGIGEMAMDMFEPRKTPILSRSNPEGYIKGGEKEMTDDGEFIQDSLQNNSTANQNNESDKILLSILKDKDNEIGDLREYIGRLKSRIEQLEGELKANQPISPITTSMGVE